MLTAKLNDHVRSRTDTGMKNEVYCKSVAHNVCCVLMSQVKLEIESVFWDGQGTEKTAIEMPPVPMPVVSEAPAITAPVGDENKPMAVTRGQMCAGA